MFHGESQTERGFDVKKETPMNSCEYKMSAVEMVKMVVNSNSFEKLLTKRSKL